MQKELRGENEEVDCGLHLSYSKSVVLGKLLICRESHFPHLQNGM